MELGLPSDLLLAALAPLPYREPNLSVSYLPWIPHVDGAILSTVEHLHRSSMSDAEDFELPTYSFGCGMAEWPNASQSTAESDPCKNATIACGFWILNTRPASAGVLEPGRISSRSGVWDL